MEIMQGTGICARGIRYKTRLSAFFLYIVYFLDHLFVLIFATAVIKRAVEWGLAYLDFAESGMVAL